MERYDWFVNLIISLILLNFVDMALFLAPLITVEMGIHFCYCLFQVFPL